MAREAVKAVKPILDAVKDGEVRDQLKRASLSVVLNIAEGNARNGKDRLNRFSFAEGSAREAMEGARVIALLDRVVAMLVGLRFPKRPQARSR